ncbi:MAG: TonB-dependent receptor domain-containing protein, partial [Rhodoferax sp.]
VLTRAAIDRSQAVDLPGLLASEAGFQFTQLGGMGTSATLFLRGNESRQVLVLVDGVPLTKQDATGSVSLEHIMLDQVERVEVVRGNVSAIYGSGAVGGVIQIFMRQGQGHPTGFAKLELGSLGTLHAAAGVSGQAEGARFSLGVGRDQTQGFSAMDVRQYPKENPDADGYRNSHYNLAYAQEIGSGHTLGLRAQGSDGQFDSDGGGFGIASDIYRGSSTSATWQVYSHHQISADWRSKLSFSQGRERSVYDARLTQYPYESEAVTQSRTLQWNNEISIGAALVTLGAEAQRQSIDSSDSYATTLSQARNVNAAFAGLTMGLGAHSLQVNLRRDSAEGLAAENTGYIGYGYQLAADWKLLASSSTAFTLPPLGYLYDVFSGNPDLQPERAHSNEIGAQWSATGQVLRATAFSSRTSKLLQYDFSSYRFSNLSAASNQGLEVSYSARLQGADLRGSLTVQDPRDEADGTRLARRARTMAAFGASRAWGDWTLGGNWRYTGERPDIAGKPELSAYQLIDLTARLALAPEWALTARIDNLQDVQYQSAYGYNQPGRGFYVGLLWNQK